jgi:hypothetical protein
LTKHLSVYLHFKCLLELGSRELGRQLPIVKMSGVRGSFVASLANTMSKYAIDLTQETLGRIPLAISEAAAYVNRHKISGLRYLVALDVSS